MEIGNYIGDIMELYEKYCAPKKRLSMWLPLELHRNLKLIATKHNITITKYVLKAITKQIQQER